MRRVAPEPRVEPVTEPHGPDGPPPVDEQARARFAEFLASARSRQGKSLDQIGAVTKIAHRHLEALERGAVESLPGGLYRRAIVRDYAACVGLDARAALELLDRTFGDDPALPGLRQLQETLAGGPARGGRETSPALLPLRRAGAGLMALARQAHAFDMVVVAAIGVAGYAAFKWIASARGAEPPVAAATLADVVVKDIRLPPMSRLADASGSSGSDESGPREHELVITTQPEGARVTVDGIGWGVTPLTIRHLPPGDKIVRVTKDGYVAGERRVRMNGTARVRLTLQPREKIAAPPL
jgi:hypothetical protein